MIYLGKFAKEKWNLEKSFKTLFYRFAGKQKLVPAPDTFQAEIHADAEDFPVVFAARMIFFQFNMLSDRKIHIPFASLT